MKIAVLAWGGTGDVLPMLALAAGLRRLGHVVNVCSPARYRAFAQERGLEFRPMALDADDVLDSGGMQSALASSNGIAAFRSISLLAERMMRGWVPDSLAAIQGADLILGGFLPGFYLGPCLSQATGIPFIPCLSIPITPTAESPSFALYFVRDLGPVLNRITSVLTLRLVWALLLPALNRARRDALRLPPASSAGWFPGHLLRGSPVLYGFSPHLIPPPSDWAPNNHVTGYWWPDPVSELTASAPLIEFLDAGAPPVCVGFGSMSSRADQSLHDVVLRALALGGWRAVYLTGTGMPQGRGASDRVYYADFIPHSWLLPRAAAAVHHGGAGTTGAVLRAGIPSVTVPHNFDQPFWGMQVARRGAGPPPILRNEVTPEKLADAIQRALSDESMRRRAAALGERVRADEGIRNAAQIIASLTA